MALAEQSQLVVTIRLNDQMSPTAVKVGKQMQDIERKTISLRKSVARVGEGLKTGLANSAKIAAAGVGFLAYNIKQGIDELVEWEDAQLQITAALKSTNGVSGVTAKMTEELALKYAELSNYEDDVILGAEAILLRFPNIKKKAFEPTLAAATDLAAGMGKDLPSAARTLALALNDPNAGLGRLTRAGITFTEQQKQQIKTLTDAGKVGKAQAIILSQVNKQYGGSASKATEGYRGNVTRLHKAIKDLQQSLAAPLLGPLSRLARRLAEFAKSKEVQQGIKDLGTAIAGLFSDENLAAGFQAMKEGIGFLRDLDWNQIRSAVSVSAEIMKTAVGMFTSLPAPLQGALVSLLAINKLTGGLGTAAIKGIGELLLSNLKTITAANVTVIGTNVVTPGQTPAATTSIVTSLAAAVASTPALAVTLGALGATLVGDQLLGPAVRSINPTYDKQYGQAFGDKTLLENLASVLTGQPIQFMGKTIQTGKGPNPALATEKSPLFNYALTRFIGLGGGQRPTGASVATRSGNFAGSSLPVIPVKFFDTLDGLWKQGKVSREYAVKLFEETQSGTKTYRQALAELKKIKGAQGEVKTAIQGQKYQFTLKPSVTISASATGKAITFAANGQRLEIL